MEEIGQNYGFLMYRTFLEGVSGVTLTIKELRDRAVVMIDEVNSSKSSLYLFHSYSCCQSNRKLNGNAVPCSTPS